MNLDEIPFLQAKYYRPALDRSIDVIVLHAAVVPSEPGRAKWLMNYCANNDRVASWHYAVDSQEITQSVKDQDIAFHAPGTNQHGIGIELATCGRPTAHQWTDDYHQKMLALTADLTAHLCRKWRIVPRYLDAQGLLAGYAGITTHAQVSLAFKKSDHDDPGLDFPMFDFIEMVWKRVMNRL